ncbi:MAG: hypothetical protein ACXW06_06955 [Halobacteriota archaeon]
MSGTTYIRTIGGLVLLPLRWETHSSPEFGTRPQAVINRQVVDQCDMVVGVFWTKLGTPTGEAESGTIEEIDRAGNAEKIVMLYFSTSKAELDKVDLDEYQKLKTFKQNTYPKGLVESYDSLEKFRDKFRNHLAMKIRDLVGQDSRQGIDAGSDTVALVNLALACGTPPKILQSGEVIEMERVLCTNEGDIPDYWQPPTGIFKTVTVSAFANKNYYRQLVSYYIQQKQYRSFRLAVCNSGDSGVQDLYFEALLRNSEGNLILPEERELLEKPNKSKNGNIISMLTIHNKEKLRITKRDNNWEIQLELPVVQAGRTVFSENEFYLGAKSNSKVRLEATVYSSHSTPLTLETSLQLVVRKRILTFQEILKELDEQWVIGSPR